jgi:hypothetical protein
MAEVTRNGLPLGQAAVVQVKVDYAFTLVLKRGDAAYEVRIEQAFEFAAADGVVHGLDPEGDPGGLGPALVCTRTVVAEAATFDNGRLELHFEDGSAIRISAGGEYEAWNLVGPDGLRIVAGPGNAMTVWSSDGS